MNIQIRKYEPADCTAMAKLFYETVHTVNAKDYSEKQLNVWATGKIDSEAWDQSFRTHYTVVALIHDTIVGFGDMAEDGYLDRLYVHKDFLRHKIATMICDELENHISADVFTTHASITAKPFFEQRGYTVVKEQQVERYGVLLTNFIMEKHIGIRSGLHSTKNRCLF